VNSFTGWTDVVEDVTDEVKDVLEEDVDEVDDVV